MNRNNLLFIIVTLFIISCTTVKKEAACNCPPLQLFEILKDKDSSKMLRGIVTKDQILNDTAFHWYYDNIKYFKPDTNAIKVLQFQKDSINIIVFGGTWCHDTQNLLPKYLSLLEAAQFPEDHLTLIMVDRMKTTINNLQKPFHITNVPTCIVMKNGKEIGRIVEYGKTAFVDKELGDLILNPPLNDSVR